MDMREVKRSAKKVQKFVWESLRSPKLLSFLKLAGAIVGVAHAIDELSSSSKSPKMKIGFQPAPPDEDEPEDEESDESLYQDS
jgi:hypothetical protein